MWFVHKYTKRFLLVAVMLWCGCAGRQVAILDRPLPPIQPAANAAALNKEAEGLWAQRGDPQKARQALEAYKRAYAVNPSQAVGTSLSRAYYFVGYYVETDPVAQDSLFLRGAEIGERVLSLNEKFRIAYRKTKDEKQALSVLDASWTPAIYWTGANLEQWASTKGMGVRYGNKGRIEAYMSRVRELDPKFFHGATHRFFGVLPTQGRAPFVKIDKAREEFEKAITDWPDFLGNKRLYAETYAVKKKDRALFIRLLQEVVNARIDKVPEIAAENKYEQARARKLLAEIDSYFEKK
ncbi:MAG: TRAP transporter TatT component family protein [candidate division KSB1 bacterium]|nr:TRAP transporter TatT component family protein [candidate division KSB1 bacterium]